MNNIKNKKYFCYEIYKNIAVWSKNGTVRYTPCSYSGYELATTDEVNVSTVWNSQNHVYLKNLIEQDMPVPGCEKCYKEEEHGLISRRLNVIDLYEKYLQDSELDGTAPISLDYSVGNLCNLKCAICGPENSTAWNKDFIELFPENISQLSKFEKFNQIKLTDIDYLKNLKNIHFHGGGEPLLVSTHIELIEAIKQAKGLGDVHVLYNTNGSVTVPPQVLDLWSECKLVELYFSIDDVGERFEYQRTGVSWDKLQENINWYIENMPVNHMFKINCTWSFLNLFYLDELVEWHNYNFSSNRLGDQVNLIFQTAINSTLNFSVDVITSKIYNILSEKFARYPQLLELINSIQIDDSVDFNNLWQEINKLDGVRETKFEILCPEFAQLLK